MLNINVFLFFFHYLSPIITISKIATILRYLLDIFTCAMKIKYLEEGKEICRRPIWSCHQAPTIYLLYKTKGELSSHKD